MNQKTAKLLKKYASHVKREPKEIKSLYKGLKDEWDRLNAEQRRKRRAVYRTAIQSAVAAAAAAPDATAATAE